MTRPSVLPVPPSEEEEQTMLDFLARSPDFFVRHAEVLENMSIRHGSGGAVSLIERQVRVLRDNNERLNTRLEQLLDTARHNEARVKGINALAQSLIRCDSIGSVISGLISVLHSEFSVEAVKLALFSQPEHCDELGVITLNAEELPQMLKDFFRMGQIVCSGMDDELSNYLFADHQELQSIALVPLDRVDCLGVLALGSTEPDRFTPDMGKLFLEMTANLATVALRYHGAKPA